MVDQFVSIPKPVADMEHAALLAGLSHGILGLLLHPMKSTISPSAAVSRMNRRASLKELQRLVQIDDVDAVSPAVDVALHLRVPTAGHGGEMDAGSQQVLHADVRLCRRTNSGVSFLVQPPFPCPAA